MTVTEMIEQRLTEALQPESLHIEDQSSQHAGHAGAASGGGHYSVMLVSPRFSGQNTIARHRMVYDALGGMMQKEIHALALKLYAPEEI